MFTNRKARRGARETRRVSLWNAAASACAFESLEGRRLMRSPVDLPTLPPLPAAPPKAPVVADAQPPVQNPGWRRPTEPIYFEGDPSRDHGDEHGHDDRAEHNGDHQYGTDFVLGPKWFQSGGPGTPLLLSYSRG